MKRHNALLVAATLAATALTLTAGGTAGAATDPCVNTTGAGMSMNGQDMGTMDHGTTGTENTKTKKKKQAQHKMDSMGTSCPTVPGAREIPVVGDAFTFTPTAITVAAGEDVTIALTAEDIGHDIYVKGIGHVVHADAGETATGGIRLDQPGTYKFWCTVSGHKKAGMTGTITVT